jgi:3-(3-hydroxy-phenyl)propionate hydroxylase
VPGAAIAGAMLPQPRVRLADGRLTLLDEVLGPRFALLAVDPIARAPRLPVWEAIGARHVRLALDDGAADPQAIVDADGLLRVALADCRGKVVVVRPDRFVLGAFAPEDEQDFLSQWDRLGGPVADRLPTPVRSTT